MDMLACWGFRRVLLVKRSHHAAMPGMQPRNQRGRPLRTRRFVIVPTYATTEKS